MPRWRHPWPTALPPCRGQLCFGVGGLSVGQHVDARACFGVDDDRGVPVSAAQGEVVDTPTTLGVRTAGTWTRRSSRRAVANDTGVASDRVSRGGPPGRTTPSPPCRPGRSAVWCGAGDVPAARGPVHGKSVFGIPGPDTPCPAHRTGPRNTPGSGHDPDHLTTIHHLLDDQRRKPRKHCPRKGVDVAHVMSTRLTTPRHTPSPPTMERSRSCRGRVTAPARTAMWHPFHEQRSRRSRSGSGRSTCGTRARSGHCRRTASGRLSP